MKSFPKLLCLSLFALCIFPLPAHSYNDADLQAALAANEAEPRLVEFKDNQTNLKLKLEVLDTINANRAKNGLAPVQLDILACRVANKSAFDAVDGGFSGHWNLKGEKPYHRYAFAGGTEHTNENAAKYTGIELEGAKKYSTVLQAAIKAHTLMYDEKAPDDGHRRNILNPWHTHAGVGFAFDKEKGMCYYEHYLDRYLQFDAFSPKAARETDVTLTGAVTADGYGLYHMIVYYEAPLTPMFVDDINKKHYYEDFSKSVAENLPFWKLGYDDATKRFQVSFKTGKPGLYYVHIYVKKGHTGKEPQGAVSTRGLTPVSGIVIRVE